MFNLCAGWAQQQQGSGTGSSQPSKNASSKANQGKGSSKSDKAEDGSQDSQSSGEGAGQQGSSKHSKDPLRWFGVLVPPSLRTAQTDFQTGRSGGFVGAMLHTVLRLPS